MSPTPSRTTRAYTLAYHFFQALFGSVSTTEGELPHALALCTRAPGNQFFRTTWTWNIEDAARLSEVYHSYGLEVYYHVALHDHDERWRAALEEGKASGKTPKRDFRFHQLIRPSRCIEVADTYFRGTIQTAKVLGALWIDLDYGMSGHEKKHLPPDRAAALDLIDKVAAEFLPPTLLIHTGHGYHVYWIFKEAWDIAEDDEHRKASDLVAALQGFFASVAARMGKDREGSPWELDSTHDLARILRVIGSSNRKGDVPIPVIHEPTTNRRYYNPCDIAEEPALQPFLTSNDTHTRSAARHGSRSGRRVVVGPPPNEELLADVQDRVDTLVENDGGFAALWRGECDGEISRSQVDAGQPVDTSLSTYTFRIAGRLLKLGWNDGDVHAALQLLYTARNRQPKPPSYYLRTIDKARPPAEVRPERTAPQDSGDGERDEDEENPAPPPPEPTRPIATDIKEAAEIVREVVEEWIPGKGSLHFCGWPGTTKTTTAGKHLLRGLSNNCLGFEQRVAVLALPTRDLVLEKVAFLSTEARKLNSSVRVVPLLGRQNDENADWYCEARLHQQTYAENHRSACMSCPMSDPCEATPGRFLFRRQEVLDAIADARNRNGPPVLLMMTTARLHWAWDDLPARIPTVLDDAGGLFGLVKEIALRRLDIDSAIDHAREHIEHHDGNSLSTLVAKRVVWDARESARTSARNEIHDGLKRCSNPGAARALVKSFARRAEISDHGAAVAVDTNWSNGIPKVSTALRRLERSYDALHPNLVADAVACVLDALMLPKSTKDPAKRDRIAMAVSHLPGTVQKAILDRRATAPIGEHGFPEWPWEKLRSEDGPDLRPRFTKLALLVATEALLGHPPANIRLAGSQRQRGRPEQLLHLPDHELVKRARSGWVLWLAVGPMPPPILEALSASQEVLVAKPRGLDVVVADDIVQETKKGPVYRSYGPGGRAPGKPSPSDEIVRAVYKGLAERIRAGSTRFMGHDLRTLGAILHQCDAEALGEPDLCEYYGARHAGTDRLADCDILLVRRCVPSNHELAIHARSLRHALRMPDSECPGEMAFEDRYWPQSYDSIGTCVPTDPLERELLRFQELHLQLNAIGRCRPLTNTKEGRLVVLLAGRPFDWINPELTLLEGLERKLGAQFDYPSRKDRRRGFEEYNTLRAEAAARRQDRILEILSEEGKVSDVELARRLSCSASTVARDRRELQRFEGLATSASGETTLPVTLGLRLIKPSVTESVVSGLPSAPDVLSAGLVTQNHRVPSLRAVQRRLKVIRERLAEATGDEITLHSPRSDEEPFLRALVAHLHERWGIPDPNTIDRTSTSNDVDILELLDDGWRRVRPKPERLWYPRRGRRGAKGGAA